MYRLLFIFMTLLSACNRSVESGSTLYPTYAGTDLGVSYTPEKTVFKIWSPVAKRVTVQLYQYGDGGTALQSHPMQSARDGVWELTIAEDLKGLFYTFQVETELGTLAETPGIYARAVGVNGTRGAILDMANTNPANWEKDARPVFTSRTDAVIYEMHVRDFSIHPSTNHQHRGKFLGVGERGTVNGRGQSTGLDHLVELGVTHVHLLPVFDFRSLDETKADAAQYNWGYDPQNYNVPEGTYSTDPFDPASRIREFKEMVMSLHERGIRVVMDVVYNHTGATEGSNFNLEVPDYYYRKTADGKWSDAAACGNETASEQPMMRKFMIESCLHWVREYHIDGFRFDLMGIHDLATMNELTATLLKEEPTLLFYGEGWTAGASPLPDSLRALKKNTHLLQDAAAFSDDLRDALKGSVFDHEATGFVSGAAGVEQSVRFGVVGATQHPQVDYASVNYSKAPWAREPWQCINYVSCHDNHTLWDKLAISAPKADEATRIRMDQLANAIVLTAQGIPFLHAGEEMLRTKKKVENSYNKPDSINQIDWDRKTRFADTFEFYRELIALRKAHPAFRLQSAEQVRRLLTFVDSPKGTVGYKINGTEVSDSWGEVMVVYNANPKSVGIDLPAGDWILRHDGNGVVDAVKKVTRQINVPGISLAILSRK
jgi:pullulanase